MEGAADPSQQADGQQARCHLWIDFGTIRPLVDFSVECRYDLCRCRMFPGISGFAPAVGDRPLRLPRIGFGPSGARITLEVAVAAGVTRIQPRHLIEQDHRATVDAAHAPRQRHLAGRIVGTGRLEVVIEAFPIDVVRSAIENSASLTRRDNTSRSMPSQVATPSPPWQGTGGSRACRARPRP